ncbi:MAG: hypothetical protein ACM3S1_15680 [Hyphomicrobiales bacterium]
MNEYGDFLDPHHGDPVMSPTGRTLGRIVEVDDDSVVIEGYELFHRIPLTRFVAQIDGAWMVDFEPGGVDDQLIGVDASG